MVSFRCIRTGTTFRRAIRRSAPLARVDADVSARGVGRPSRPAEQQFHRPSVARCRWGRVRVALPDGRGLQGLRFGGNRGRGGVPGLRRSLRAVRATEGIRTRTRQCGERLFAVLGMYKRVDAGDVRVRLVGVEALPDFRHRGTDRAGCADCAGRVAVEPEILDELST